MEAADALAKLQNEADRSETNEIEANTSTEDANTAIEKIAAQASVLTRFRNSLVSVEDPSQRQVMILQNSAHILHDLLHQWTTFASEDRAHSSSRHAPSSSDISDTSSNKPSANPPRSPNPTSFFKRGDCPRLDLRFAFGGAEFRRPQPQPRCKLHWPPR